MIAIATGSLFALACLVAAVLLTCLCVFSGRSARWSKCIRCHCHYNDQGDISYSEVTHLDNLDPGLCPNCYQATKKP